MNKYENNLGIGYQNSGFKIFFGNKLLTEEKLDEVVPNTPVQFMLQTHGIRIEEFNESKKYSCDGLTTTQPHIALAIKTADCMPIIIIHNQRIFAIHAGWRGLVEGILFSTKSYVDFDSSSLVFIGPHIQVNSFEVGAEVAEQAILSLEKKDILFKKELLLRSHKNIGKAYLDLAYLAKCQLERLNVNKDNILQTKVDTFTEMNWHSHRREAGNAGRNIHLVLKS